MAKVWIVNPFDPLPGDPEQPGRYATLACLLAAAGHEVTWWTATWSHRFKREIEPGAIHAACRQLGITARFVSVPGYQSNVSLARVRSHRAYADGFVREALCEPSPQVIIASNPPLESAAAAASIKAACGARLIVDVQDIWIDTSRRFLPPVIRWGWRLLFQPWIRANRRAYADADAVVGVAGGYADEPRRYGRRDYRREVVPLGIDLASFDAAVSKGRCLLGEKPPGEIWAIYSGSLSRNYDVLTVAAAAARVSRERDDVRFIFSGRGHLEPEVRRIVAGAPRVDFLGFAPFEDWAATVTQCDIGWNAAWPEALVLFPNKVFYYWAAGLAVLNSIPGECADWVDRTGTGLTYRAGDVDDACRAMTELAADHSRVASMCTAARQGAENLWDRRVLYRSYVELIEELAGAGSARNT